MDSSQHQHSWPIASKALYIATDVGSSVLPFCFISLLVYIVDQWQISSSLHPFDFDIR